MSDLVPIGWKFEVVDNYLYLVKAKLKKFWMHPIHSLSAALLGFKLINFCGPFVMMDYSKKLMLPRTRMLQNKKAVTVSLFCNSKSTCLE